MTHTRVERAAVALAATLLLGAAGAARAQVPPGRPGGEHWQRQMQRWDGMPEQRREDILREQQRYRELPPQEQQRLFEQYRRRQQR